MAGTKAAQRKSQKGGTDADADVAKVSSALSTWSEGGRDTILKIVLDQVSAAAADPLRTLKLAHSLHLVVTSSLDSQAAVDFIADVVAALPDDDKAESETALSMALLDTVDELKLSELDAKDDDKDHNPAMDAKAQDVVNKLATNKTIPQHFINLLITPTHLISTGLHPFPAKHQDLLRRGLAKLQTSALFKQRISNLLREASEGFSHLIVLLTGPSVFSSSTDETDEERQQRAKDVWADIENVIGTYNLAPIRVLDLIIEVASCHVASQWRFFLDLLQASYWGRHQVPVSAVMTGVMTDEASNIARSMDVSDADDSTIAKALGFWFSFYQHAENGDSPTGLTVFAALLIKHGFVKPAFLLPNLSPDDEGMAEIEKRHQAAMSSRSGPQNALMNTVLADDENPASSGEKTVEDVEKPKPKNEQKIQLLQALLSIGEVDLALQLLARYPWVPAAYPNIGQLIIRNIDYCIDPVYQRFTKLPGYSAPPVRQFEKIVPTLVCPQPPATATTEHRFFYPNWSDDMVRWESIEDLNSKGEHWLRLLSGLGGRGTGTMTKICRIMKVHFDDLRDAKIKALGLEESTLTRQQKLELRATEQEIAPWSNLIRGTLLPALSLSDAAAASFDHELEQVLNEFPWETLASLIGEWRDGITNAKARGHLPAAANAATKATRDIKQALSRVTAAQSNPSAPTPSSQASERVPARALAKHGRGNPIALWTISNSQVMAYGSVGNIGEHIIEVGRYTNKLSKDVAVFTWADTLANANTNHKSVENLSTFVGLINRRFNFNLEPLLQLIASGLKNNNLTTLTVIEKLISGMSGEDIVGNFAISVEQLDAYSAGTEMRSEAFYSTENTRGERKPRRSIELISQVKKSLPRLMSSLRSTGLAVPVLVGLARVASKSLVYDADLPVREMSNRRDYAHDVFTQYSTLIEQHLPKEELCELLPGLRELQTECGIEPQLAWMIVRSKLNALEAHEPVQAKDESMDVDSNGDWWPQTLSETISEVDDDDELLDKPGKRFMGSPFFVRFYSLQASDIHISPAMYDKAVDRINQLLRDLTGPAVKDTAEIRSERARLQARIRLLQAEKTKREAHVQRVRDQLQAESGQWFNSQVVEKAGGALAAQLHDRCFYPRAIDSPEGAVFVAKFIRMAHDFNVPGFSTMLAYNLFLRPTLTDKIFECTEAEARNLGRCLLLMMTDLDRWLQSEEVYYSEALGGTAPEKDVEKEASANGPATESIIPEHTLKGMYYRSSPTMPHVAPLWSVYKNILGKLHNNLSQSLVACWNPDNPSYSPKNAVVIALQLLPVFPIITTNAKAIEEAVKNLRDKKDGSITPDIVPAFNSYLSQLTNRKKERPCAAPSKFFPAIAAKLKAEAEAKAKADAAAKEKEAEAAAAAAASGDAAEDKEKSQAIEVSEPAAEDVETSTNGQTAAVLHAGKADAKALRAKLEQNRNTRAANAAAKAVATPQTHPLPPNPMQAAAAAAAVRDANASAMGPPGELSADEARAAARARKFGHLTSVIVPPREPSPRNTPQQRSPPREPRGRGGSEDVRGSDRRRGDRDGRDERREREERERGERGGRDDRRGDRRDPRDPREEHDRRERHGDRRDERRHDERRRDDRRDGRDRDSRGGDTPRTQDSQEERSRDGRDAREGRENRDRSDRRHRDRDDRARDSPRDREPPSGPLSSRAERFEDRDRAMSKEKEQAPQKEKGVRGDDRDRYRDRERSGDRDRRSRGPRSAVDERPPSAVDERGPRSAIDPRPAGEILPPPATHERPPHEATPTEDNSRKREREAGRGREDDEKRRRSGRDRDGRDSRGGTPRSQRTNESPRQSPKPDSLQVATESTSATEAASTVEPGPASNRRESRREAIQREARGTPTPSASASPRSTSVRGSATRERERELLPPSSSANSLAARMGLAPSSDEGGRKRGHDEIAPASREDSPGTKRRRGGRGRGEGGRDRESASGRLLGNAMRAANDK